MWYWTKVLFLVFIGALVVWLGYEFITFPNTAKLRNENPTTTSMIEYRISEAKQENREPRKYMVWMPIEQISPHLAKAVLAGEDTHFFEHHGFDWDAINKAWEEAAITYFLERNLSKKRILEIYLNVIEWGDGIYGAEAASRTYFKKSASALTQQEAAYLSAMIPSPLNVFNPQKNPKRVVRRQKVILRGMNYIKLAY